MHAAMCRHVPERALHARGLPRPLFLIGVSLLTAAVAVLCAFASLGALYLAALLAGLAFGGHWSLAPALASDFFGLRHFASNYCLLQVLITILRRSALHFHAFLLSTA